MSILNSPTLSGDVSGKIYSTTVNKIKGYSISSAVPTNGQALVFNGNEWTPGIVSGGGILTIGDYLSSGGGTVTGSVVINYLGSLNSPSLSLRGNLSAASISVVDGISAEYLTLDGNLSASSVLIKQALSANSISIAKGLSANSIAVNQNLLANSISVVEGISAQSFQGNGTLLTNIKTRNIQSTTEFSSISCGSGVINIQVNPEPDVFLQWYGNNWNGFVSLQIYNTVVANQSYIIYNNTKYTIVSKTTVGSDYKITLDASLGFLADNNQAAAAQNGPIVNYFVGPPPTSRINSNALLVAPSLSATSSIVSNSGVFVSLSATNYLGINTSSDFIKQVNNTGTTTMLISCSLSSVQITPGNRTSPASSIIDIFTQDNANSAQKKQWTFESDSLTYKEGNTKTRTTSFADELVFIDNNTIPSSGIITYESLNYDILMFTQQAVAASLTINVIGKIGTTYNGASYTSSVKTIGFISNWGTTTVTPILQIDGTPQVIKWLGGTGTSSGNSASYDIWTFTIIKTGVSTYIVLGNVARYY